MKTYTQHINESNGNELGEITIADIKMFYHMGRDNESISVTKKDNQNGLRVKDDTNAFLTTEEVESITQSLRNVPNIEFKFFDILFNEVYNPKENDEVIWIRIKFKDLATLFSMYVEVFSKGNNI